MSNYRIKPSLWRNSVLAVLVMALVSGVALAQTEATPTTAPATDVPATDVPATDASALTEEQVRTHRDHVKWKRDHVDGLRREIKDITREAKDVSTAEAENIINVFETCVNELEALAGKSPEDPFWDKNWECDQHATKAEDHFNDVLRPQRDCVNAKNQLKNRQDERNRNIANDLKDMKRNGLDTSSLDPFVAKIDELIQKGNSALTTCTRDSVDDFWQNINQDLDWAFRDFYDAAGPIREKADTDRRVKDFRQDFDKNIKRNCERDKGQQIKDFKRELERAGEKAPQSSRDALAGIEAIYNKLCVDFISRMESGLKSAESATDAEAKRTAIEEAEYARQDYWDEDRTFWDSLNEARETLNQVTQIEECKRELKNRRNEYKNMEREYKNVTKGDREFPKLKELLDQYLELLQKAENYVPAAGGNCWELHEELNWAQSDFWDRFNEVGRIGDFDRWYKDTEREWFKHRPRELKDIERNLLKEGGSQNIVEDLKRFLEEGQEFVRQAKKAIDAKDPEQAQDILGFELQNVREKWDDLVRNFYDSQELKYKRFELKQIKREILDAKRELEGRRDIPEDRKNRCLGYTDKGLSIIQRIEEGDVQAWGELEEIGFNADRECSDVFDDEGKRPNIREFRQDFDLDIDEDRLEAILNKVTGDLVNDVLQKAVLRYEALIQQLTAIESELEDHMAKLLGAVSSFVPQDKAEKLLQEKEEFLDLAEQVKVAASRPGCERLREVKEKVERATLIDDSAAKLKSLMESFISKNPSGDVCRRDIDVLLAQVDGILGEGADELYTKQIIPYKDTGVDQWFTPDVANLTQLGIVAGKFDSQGRKLGIFDPGQKVKVSEILKMVYEATGVGPSKESPNLCNRKYADHWAAGYVARAEEAGLSIVSECTDVNRDATRGEVVQIILEGASVVPPKATKSEFPDVSLRHPLIDFLNYAKSIGLLQGDKNGHARADDSIIRAEAAAVVKRAINKLAAELGGGPNGGDFDEEDEAFFR